MYTVWAKKLIILKFVTPVRDDIREDDIRGWSIYKMFTSLSGVGQGSHASLKVLESP